MLYQLSYTHRGEAPRIYSARQNAQGEERTLVYSPGFVACLVALAGCVAGRPVLPSGPPPEARETGTYAEMLAALRAEWLAADTIAAPVVSYDAQTRDGDGVVVTVAPGLPEDQPWNHWPDGSARLFNDGVGYLWLVRIDSERPARWSPEHTRLAVNVAEQTFDPAVVPDDLLLPLLRGAAVETRLGVSTDLSLRLRNADGFRRAYLGTAVLAGAREGVVVFPAPVRNVQTVAMELTLGVWVEGDGLREYRFLFE